MRNNLRVSVFVYILQYIITHNNINSLLYEKTSTTICDNHLQD